MTWKILKSNDRYWDYFLNLKIGNSQVKMPVEKKSEVRNMHLPQLQNLKKVNPDFILITSNIAKPLRRKLREIKINFVDGYGNASINIGNIHIYIDEIFDRHPDMLELNWDISLPPRLLGRHIGLILKEQNMTKNKLTELLSE